jgi:hypothetical protein
MEFSSHILSKAVFRFFSVVAFSSLLFNQSPASASLSFDGEGFLSGRFFEWPEMNSTGSAEIEGNIVQLLHVTSDAMEGSADIRLSVDADFRVQSGMYVTSGGQRSEFTPEMLRAGVVLLRKSGKNVVTLVSRNFDPRRGGQIDLVYLENGISGSTGRFPMEIVLNGNQWSLQTNDRSGRRTFTSMFLKGRFVLGKAIGIKSVSVK